MSHHGCKLRMQHKVQIMLYKSYKFISLLQEPAGAMDFGNNLVNNVVMKTGSCMKGSKEQLE